MNWVDWLVVALLLLGLIQGVLRGWVAALVGTLVALAAFIGSSALLPLYAEGVSSLPMPPEWARTIAFGIVLLGLYVILSVVVSTLLRGARRPGLPDQVPGGLLGVIRGAALASLLLGLLAATPAGDALTRDIRASRLGDTLLDAEGELMRTVHRQIPAIPPIGPDRRL